MVRAVLLAAVILALTVTSPATASSAAYTPEAMAPEDEARFAALPKPPEAARLYAQLSSTGDAFLTLQPDILKSSYTPVPALGPEPAIRFEVFAYVAVAGQDAEGTQYQTHVAPALWDAAFVPDVGVVAEWHLASSHEPVAGDGPAPPILVSTALKSIDGEGFARLLSWRTVRVEIPYSTQPVPLRVTLPPPADSVRAGERLVLELDWTWATVAAFGAARPPLVTIHPGSFVDIPLAEPIRVIGFEERKVLGDLYVQAEVAHVFALQNLDIPGLNLLMAGPGVNTQGGRPFIVSVQDGETAGHAAVFDWRVPLRTHGMTAGAYALFVTAGQMGEDGPRAIAKRTVHVESAVVAAAEGAAVPASAVIALAALGCAVPVGLVLRRRPGA